MATSPPEPSGELERLERWMLAAIAHPDASATFAAEAAERVRGPGPLDPVAGMAIYQKMYPLRLGDALDVDFPVLKSALGESAFEALCRDYIRDQPSTSFTLSRYGDRLPEYVARWRVGAKKGAWLVDLARFELEQTLAIQSPAGPTLDPAALTAVPPDAWDRALLVPSPSLRLMTAAYDVPALYHAYLADQPLALPPKRRITRIAIAYREQSVDRSIRPRPYALLEKLVAGERLGPAIAAAFPRPTPEAASELQVSLSDWVAAGFFSQLSVT